MRQFEHTNDLRLGAGVLVNAKNRQLIIRFSTMIQWHNSLSQLTSRRSKKKQLLQSPKNLISNKIITLGEVIWTFCHLKQDDFWQATISFSSMFKVKGSKLNNALAVATGDSQARMRFLTVKRFITVNLANAHWWENEEKLQKKKIWLCESTQLRMESLMQRRFQGISPERTVRHNNNNCAFWCLLVSIKLPLEPTSGWYANFSVT